jgi:hypothetical protein
MVRRLLQRRSNLPVSRVFLHRVSHIGRSVILLIGAKRSVEADETVAAGCNVPVTSRA